MYIEVCFQSLYPVLSMLLLETKSPFWNLGKAFTRSLSPSAALYPDIAGSVPLLHFILLVIQFVVAIIAHKARSCYLQCKRWTHRVCRCFHGGMQYNKIYETLCRMLMLLKEGPCSRSFLALLKLFKNNQKPVLVWFVNYRLKKLYIVEVAL